MRRVAILGAGIGAAHAEGYRALPDRFEVAAVCDLNADRAAQMAGPGGRVETAMDAVLSDPSIDIVDICLPPHLHLSASVAALEAGKAVVCEKPLVASLAEGDRLAAKAAETGLPVFPVFQYRYGIGTAQMRALMEAGLCGRPYVATLETHWNRPPAYYDIPWRGTWAGERGGALLGHAIHIHDLLPSILGPVASVFAEVATRVNAIEVEDCAALTIRMESGALVTSSVTLGAADDTSRLRLVFEAMTVESDHAPYAPAAAPWRFTAREPRRQEEIDAVLAGVGEAPMGYAGLFAALADAMDGRGGAEVTLADGLRSLEFVTACYASARSGERVALPLAKGHPMRAGWVP